MKKKVNKVKEKSIADIFQLYLITTNLIHIISIYSFKFQQYLVNDLNNLKILLEIKIYLNKMESYKHYLDNAYNLISHYKM